MKIQYLFSRNKKIGSKLIAWASKYENLDLEHIPSHGAILINEKMVVESVFGSGVRIVPYHKWKEINEELYKIDCEQGPRSSTDIVTQMMGLWGKPYDWNGIAYFAYRFIRLIMFKETMPKKNKWERASHLFCIELIGKVSGLYYSMTSPSKMCAKLLEKR